MMVYWQNSFCQFNSLKGKRQGGLGDAKPQSPIRKIWDKF